MEFDYVIVGGGSAGCRPTLTEGSSESRDASVQPAEPPPTMT